MALTTRWGMKSPEDIVRPYLKMKEELQRIHGLQIGNDAIFVAAWYLWRKYGDGTSPEEEMHHILSEACELTQSKILTNADEKELDNIEYILCRSLVEYNGLAKEKDWCSKLLLPRVYQQLNDAETKLLTFINSWEPISTLPHLTPELIQRLQAICRPLHLALEAKNLSEISNLLSEFLELLNMLDRLIRNKFREFMTVGTRQVEEVMSRLSGIPILSFPSSGIKISKTLGKQLCEMVWGHDHVIAAFVKSLFFPCLDMVKWRLPRVFLFLGPSGVGKAELAKAIAVHLFDSVDRLIRIDMSDFTESALERLADTVSTRPYSVLLFDKIEKAHSYILDTITQILAQGELIDGQGHRIDFTKTMVFMTSYVGAKQLDLVCRCFARVELREELKRNPRMRYEKHDCPLKGSGPERVVEEAKRFFKPELLNLLEDIYVFDRLRSYKPVARIVLRDVAGSITEQGIVVYPSDDALNVLTDHPFRDGHIIKRWLAENVVPMLSKMVIDGKIDESPIVYIDTLLGTRELSFRLESRGNLVENWLFKKCKKSLRKLRAVYRADREVANLIIKLKGPCSGLMHSITEGRQNFGLESGAVSIGTMKDLLISFQRSLNSVLQDPNVSVPDSIVVSHRHRKVVQEGSQSLKNTLQERVRGKHQAIDVIADAVLRSIDAPPDPPNKPSGVYLLLGLSNACKMELVRGLSEHLLTIEGKTPLIQVDLSDKLKSQSLLCSAPKSHGKCSLSILEAVKSWPYCVLLFDKVEKADTSVFSTLVGVLDTGMSSDSDGLMVDFRNTIIIITSDLGDNDFISRLFGCSYPGSGNDDHIQQEESCIRTELLNHVDEIIFFNPASHDQRDIARLPMTEGRGGRALGIALMNLFGRGRDLGKFSRRDYAVHDISIGLIRSDHPSVSHSKGFQTQRKELIASDISRRLEKESRKNSCP